MDQWWKHTVFYEIYMMSFCDSNGDGIGDISGIISKLSYLEKMGVGGIWLTPFYPSPKVDNGYDISDYFDVDPDYGTMEDFERLVSEAHNRGIRVIADMVVNHTSTRHPWFLESASSVDNPKRDWYIWKDPVDGGMPNNWESFFGGSAWEFDQESGQYYYHSFAKEQADLNWQNPEVEEAIYGVLEYWLQKGIDGFRFDVINNLWVSGGMADNPVTEGGEQMHVHDVNQPGIHQVLGRMNSRIREKKPDAFLVGEISSEELKRIHSYVVCDGLDTTFNFNLGSREQFRLNEIMEEMRQMQSLYGSDQNPTIFFGSHDMKRFPDRFSFSEEKVKCLLTLMMVSRGIPFLYFGDELGMRSRVLSCVEEAKDIQGILAYEMALKEGKEKSEALQILNEASRDASRNFMDWEEAGRQMEEPSSVFCYTRSLIKIRTSRKELELGEMRLQEPAAEVMKIERILEQQKIVALINFSDEETSVSVEPDFRVLLASKKCLKWMPDHRVLLPSESCLILEYKDGDYDNTEIRGWLEA